MSQSLFVLYHKETRECSRCPRDGLGELVGVAQSHNQAVSIAKKFMDSYLAISDQTRDAVQQALAERSSANYSETGSLQIKEVSTNQLLV